MIGEGAKSGVALPDTQEIAKAYKIKYVGIKNYHELTKVKQVLDSKEAVICEIFCPEWQDILTVSSKKLASGKMVSLPIDDMSPFLPEKEMNKIRNELR